jgi:ferritin-like metal-binding protein YciE
MALATLEDLLASQVRDLTSAEARVSWAFAGLTDQAAHERLANAFWQSHGEAEGRISRLAELAGLLGMAPGTGQSRGIEGILHDSAATLGKGGAILVLDAGLIAGARRLHHQMISGYSAARALAELLGLTGIGLLLDASLSEEESADRALASLAESTVNPGALFAEMLDGQSH